MIAAVAASLQQESGVIVQHESYTAMVLVYPEAAGTRMLKDWEKRLAVEPGAMLSGLDHRDMFFVKVKGEVLEVQISEVESIFFELADPACFRKISKLVLKRAYSQ